MISIANKNIILDKYVGIGSVFDTLIIIIMQYRHASSGQYDVLNFWIIVVLIKNAVYLVLYSPLLEHFLVLLGF